MNTAIENLANRYLPALDDTMRAVVRRLPNAPEFNVMVQYPLGWVNADGTAYDHPTGKRIRPILLLLATEASGGDWHQALYAAAAVELLHNFSLIHDDIQDTSETRHGRPTVWKVWGVPSAINVGDAMFSLAYTALSMLDETSVSDSVQLALWRIFNVTNLELTRGQHLDMRFERQSNVETDEYLSMIEGKSAALLSACASMGAWIGTHDAEIAGHYAAFGLNLGIAFQIRDDILGIWGDPSVTGKSAATDILSRKKSLPVLHGLQNSDALTDLYAKPKFTRRDVAKVIGLLDSVDARSFTQNLESRYFHQAIHALESANPQGAPAAELIALTQNLFGRAV